MTQTYKVQVSMNQAHIVESGFVWKQGDFGFNIEIEVLDFDTTGATPQIIFRKSNGAVEATQISVAGNKFTYAIRGTELDTPGPCVCDLKLKDSTTKRVSTASFKYFVIPDTMDGLNQHADSYSDTIEQIWETLQNYSEDSEAWAKGTKGGTPVPSTDTQYHNNAKYYSELSDGSADDSEASSKNSEAWAVGTKGGTPVGSSEPQYHNNSKYYSDLCITATGELAQAVAALDTKVDGVKGSIVSEHDYVNEKMTTFTNLFNPDKLYRTQGIGYVDESGDAAFVAASNVFPNTGAIPVSCEASTRYTISFEYYCEQNVSSTGRGMVLQANYSDNTTSELANILNTDSTYTQTTGTSSANKTLVSITPVVKTGSGNIFHIKKIMLVKGVSAASYVPYLIPKDYGARDIISRNRDTFEVAIGSIPLTLNNGFYNSDGTIGTQTVNKEKYTDKIAVEENEVITMIVSGLGAATNWLAIARFDSESTFINRVVIDNTSVGSYKGSYTINGCAYISVTFRTYDTAELIVTTDKYQEEDTKLQSQLNIHQSMLENFNSHIRAFDTDYYIGNIAAGVLNPTLKYRVSTDLMQFMEPITLRAESGFGFFLHFYDANKEFVRSSGKTNYLVLEPGQYFKLTIARQTENTGETADINVFKKQVYITLDYKENVYDSAFMTNGKMHLVGHKGCHHDTIIANSKPAFIEAGLKGLWGCETDIRATSDDVLICMHDATVDATTDGTGSVDAMTFAEIEELHLLNVDSSVSEEKVPTFEEYLQICKMYGLIAFAEIKIGYTYGQQILDLVKKYKMENQTVFIVGKSMIFRMRPLTNIPLCVLATPSDLEEIVGYNSFYSNISVCGDYTSTISAEDIEDTHDNDVPIGFYTVNDKTAATTKFLAGADFIITDILMPESWAE